MDLNSLTMLGVLHEYAELSILQEGVVILDDVGVLEDLQEGDLILRIDGLELDLNPFESILLTTLWL